MILYPKSYFKKIEDINIEFLQKNKIKALLLDLDNTLIDYNQNIKEETIQWVKELKGQGVKIYILSNTNNKLKIEKISKTLEVPYEKFAKKPLKSSFLKIQKILNFKPENIAVIGDQIFTDVIGGNRCKMHTILIEPIEKKDYWYTAWKRGIENKIKTKYLEKQMLKENKDVYK